MALKHKYRQADAAARHYDQNKAKMKDRAAKQNVIARKRNADFVEDYLLAHPCVDCGENDTIVLTFDHVRGIKKANIADMVKNCCSIQAIMTEILKCDVRCCNDHARRTYERRILAMQERRAAPESDHNHGREVQFPLSSLFQEAQ